MSDSSHPREVTASEWDVGRVTATETSAGSGLHVPGTSGFRRLNGAMVVAGLAAFGLLYAAQPVLAEVGEEYDVSPGSASLAVSAATGALALSVIPFAAVAARWGRVRTMRACLVAAVVLTALVALAPSFDLLVVLRVLSGVALAGVVAVAMGHVGAEVHPSGLGSAMGLYVAGNSLGGVGGRLLVSVVADVTSWRVGIAVLAAAAALATAIFWWILPEPVADVGTAPEPHGFARLLRRPEVLALLGVPFLLMGSFVAVYNYLGFRLLGPEFGLPLTVVGLVFLAYLAGTVSSAAAGRLVDRVGRTRVLLVAVPVMLVGLVLTLPGVLALVVLGVVVFTAGFFAAHATASGWAPVLGAPYGTRASALYVCAYYAGSSVFGTLVGLAWSGAGWNGVVLSVALLSVLGLLAGSAVVALVGRREPAP